VGSELAIASCPLGVEVPYDIAAPVGRNALCCVGGLAAARVGLWVGLVLARCPAGCGGQNGLVLLPRSLLWGSLANLGGPLSWFGLFHEERKLALISFQFQTFLRTAPVYVHLCSGIPSGKKRRATTQTPAAQRLQPVTLQNMFASRTTSPQLPTPQTIWRAPHPNARAPVLYNKVRGTYPTDPITDEEKRRVTAELEADVTVAETRRVRESYWRTWCAYHARWFGPRIPALPLIPSAISAIAAQMKSRGYRSYPNYLSAAKERHLDNDFAWTADLERTRKKCVASTQRGIGPSRQSLEICPLRIAALGLGADPVVEGGPVSPGHWAVLCAFHMLRGAESACALAASLSTDVYLTKETFCLPGSKTDPQGTGCRRSWGCVCKAVHPSSDEPQGCPYHAAVALLYELTRRFGDRNGALPSGLPLFPTATGDWCTREGFVRTITYIADLLQVDTIDDQGRSKVGEHVWRVSGSRMLAYANVTIPVIMLMARWGSDVILRYVEDAPLRHITADYVRGSSSSSPAPAAVDESWHDAADIHADDVNSSDANTDAVALIEPSSPRTPVGRFALNTLSNYIHIIARRESWERVKPDRTQCGRDYCASDWAVLQMLATTHERNGATHMVFRCGMCAKPPVWALHATANDEPSDSD
jgi:hypothetical protein